MMVEVSVRVSGAVVAERPVSLDALLEWSVSRERDLPWLSRGHEIPEPLPIPVHLVHYPGGVLPLCTQWVPDGAPYRHDWVRRRDGVDVESLARPYNRSYGPGRDLMLRAYGANVAEARWLLSTNDAGRVGELLQRVTHLGKLRAHGCGELGAAWVVSEAPGATPLRALVDAEGRAARAIPVAALESWDGPVERRAVQAPYWHPARQVAAVAPGTPVVLIPELRHALEGM